MALPRSAGDTLTKAENDSTAACLAAQQRPTTPPNIAKWRKSYYSVPGQRVLHPGLVNDFKDQSHTHRLYGGGHASVSDHVEDVLVAPGVDSEYATAKYAQREAVYHSTQREPLGKSYVRGHRLPDRTGHSEFQFGKGSTASESAKGILYPEVKHDEEQFHGQYVKSHHAYEPGEQRTRAYDWDIDTTSHRFGMGMGSSAAMNGASGNVRLALMQQEPARVTSLRTENFKAMGDHLGRARNLGHGGRQGHPEVYGKATLPVMGDGRACIEGTYSVSEQQPDPDLGKSITPGFRNTTTETRAFGCPSIRSDIPKYATRSIADNQNYGDDVNAQFLLYPQQFSSMGVEDSDFLAPRPKEEILSIFRTSGTCKDVSDAELEAVWNLAASDTRGVVTVKSFQNALNDLLEMKHRGK